MITITITIMIMRIIAMMMAIIILLHLKWLELGGITETFIVLRLNAMFGRQEDLMPGTEEDITFPLDWWYIITNCEMTITFLPACWQAPWRWSRSQRRRSCRWWRRTCPCRSSHGSQSAGLLCLSPSCQPKIFHMYKENIQVETVIQKLAPAPGQGELTSCPGISLASYSPVTRTSCKKGISQNWHK